MLIPDEDMNKVETQKVNIDELQRKIEEQARKKEEKMLAMKQAKEQKELEGCTFAPQRLTKKKKEPEEIRDLDKFLED
jgi:hypothetical protein